MAAYASNFRPLASDLTWNDAALMSQYRLGLSSDIKNMLVFSPRSASIIALIDLSDEWLSENKPDLTHPAPAAVISSSSNESQLPFESVV